MQIARQAEQSYERFVVAWRPRPPREPVRGRLKSLHRSSPRGRPRARYLATTSKNTLVHLIRRMQLGAVRGGEAHVSQHVMLGLVHQGGEPGRLGPELVGDPGATGPWRCLRRPEQTR